MKKQAVTTMFISPVPRVSVQGRSQYQYITPSGKAVNAERNFAKGVGKRYNFPASSDGSKIVTKLGRMIDNPWYNLDPQDVNKDLVEHMRVGPDWMAQAERLVKPEKITKQLELEVRFNLEEGHLTDKKNLDYRLRNRGNNDRGNYLETFTAILYDRANRVDDTTLRGALIMELAKVSKKVAPAKDQANPSMHDFYISTENEAVLENNNKQDKINDAIADLTLLRRQHTLFVRYQIAVVLDLIKGVVNEATIKQALNNFIAVTSKSQLKNIDKFNEINALILEGKAGMEKLWIKYLLKQAQNVNAMSLKSGHFIWHSKKGVDNLYDLGSSESKVFKLFYDEFTKYGDDDVVENHYKDLLDELNYKGVKISE